MVKQILISIGFLFAFSASAETYTVQSPNNRIQLSVNNDVAGLHYKVSMDDKLIISDSPLGLIIDNKQIGNSELKLISKEQKMIKDSFELIAGRSKKVKDNYQSMILRFKNKQKPELNLNLLVRVYDHGVAFRYQIPVQKSLSDFTIQNELTRFSFAKDYQCFGLNMGKFSNGHEGEFDPVKASSMREHNLFDSPLVCKTGEGQTTFALAESDVKHYPGSWYTGRGDGGLGVSILLTPRFDSRPDGLDRSAAKVSLSSDFNTPWRVIMLGDKPGDLTESSLIAALGEPTKIKNTSWIKPGKVAWDWWNDNQVVLNDPNKKPGMNTDTYKAYIDFASTLGLPYILIDAGWHEGAAWGSRPGSNIIKPIPEMDMPEILAYAKQKNVGVWVWLQWKQLDWQMEEGLKTYEQWGIKGIKVDFLERSDQEMVDYYHKLLSMTGKYHIMVDLHGTFPPNGLNRTYPHLLTQEGIMGAEFNKWSSRVTATHNVTVPFTRMILGPMDYTPGGFRHATPEEFPALRRNTLPYVQTTRGQALAMYVVFDSPLQMLADSPISYSKTDGKWPKSKSEWQDGLEFIQQVPVTWDETKILRGDIGQYIVSARRSGKDWYIGAMTNESARTVEIALDFLGKGKYAAEIWQDGKNVSSIEKTSGEFTSADKLSLKLAGSGGAVVFFKNH